MSPFEIPDDPYWKLRPPTPTCDEELCDCTELEAIILRDSLGSNPLYCFCCNGEVAPERIGFDTRFAEDIAFWRGVHRSLYLLWLDSGEYEEWAKEQLKDPTGQVNETGLGIASRLCEFVETFYWWFNDQEDPRAESCPVCGGEIESAGSRVKVCYECKVLI